MVIESRDRDIFHLLMLKIFAQLSIIWRRRRPQFAKSREICLKKEQKKLNCAAKQVVASIRKHFKVFRVIAWRKKQKKIKNRRIHAFDFIHFTSSTLCQISNFKTTAVNDKKRELKAKREKKSCDVLMFDGVFIASATISARPICEMLVSRSREWDKNLLAWSSLGEKKSDKRRWEK